MGICKYFKQSAKQFLKESYNYSYPYEDIEYNNGFKLGYDDRCNGKPIKYFIKTAKSKFHKGNYSLYFERDYRSNPPETIKLGTSYSPKIEGYVSGYHSASLKFKENNNSKQQEFNF